MFDAEWWKLALTCVVFQITPLIKVNERNKEY
jgi:hypothetical protein